MPTPEDMKVSVLDAELVGSCNYKCQMCPQSIGREKEFKRKLPFHVFEKMLEDGLQHGLETVTLHGSGEPTLAKDFPKYVKAVKDRGLTCISFTNGKRLSKEMSEELVEAGIDILRLSAIGYDEETYTTWMEPGMFQTVRDNFRYFVNCTKGTPTEAHINHLVIDQNNLDHEIVAYQEAWGTYTGAFQEIWLMHNWANSDKINLNYVRFRDERRSCGRPFAPLLQVRAGGLDGHNAAVVACCMVLGKDSEGVLGHLDDQSIEEVVNGAKYQELRSAHAEGRFDDIPYCKGCDQLYEVPESLVWCNIPGREYGQSKNLSTLRFTDYS